MFQGWKIILLFVLVAIAGFYRVLIQTPAPVAAVTQEAPVTKDTLNKEITKPVAPTETIKEMAAFVEKNPTMIQPGVAGVKMDPNSFLGLTLDLSTRNLLWNVDGARAFAENGDERYAF